MKKYKELGEETLKRQFVNWIKCLEANKVESVEKLYTKIFDEIRKNSTFTKKPVKKDPKRDHKKFRTDRLNAKKRW